MPAELMRGRVAIVTGGTRGLGRAMAIGLAEHGVTVVIPGRTEAACVAAAAEIAASTGGTVVGVAAHAGDPDAMTRLADTTADRFSRIDIVVNNAGISLGMPVGEITLAGARKSLEVNFLGPLSLIQAALPHLRKSPCPSVINVVTTGTDRPGKGLAVYTTSKAALQMLTRAMALELAAEGIRVNAISPGPFSTDMLNKMAPERRAEVEAGIPLGRIADPAEITGALLYLGSEAASFVTGHVLVVDGGQTIGF